MQLEVKKALDKFGKSVVKQTRTQLTKKDKNASKKLWKSIGYDLKVSKNSFQLSFEMEDYGKFQDRGVTGKNASGFKGKKKKVQRSLSGFRFGSGNFKGKGEEWEKRIDKWMFSRGIAPRDKESGKFIKRSTVNFLIRRSIFQHGIAASKFFSRPFEVAFKQLPEDLLKAFGLEVDTLLNRLLT